MNCVLFIASMKPKLICDLFVIIWNRNHGLRSIDTTKVHNYMYNLPLEKYNQFCTLLFIYKIKNKLIKNNVALDINQNTYSTRQISDFVIQFFRTSIGQNNVFYEGVKLFNSLPNHLKSNQTISKFKTLLKIHLHNQ